MPKVFVDARSHILEASKSILEEKGYDNFTMRDCASSSGYAIGTIYNYFPNKLSILATLLLEEWTLEENELNSQIEKSATFKDALKAIYELISSFYLTHKKLFSSINVPAEFKGKLRLGHEYFLQDIKKFVIKAQDKFGLESGEVDRYNACILLIQGTSIYQTPFENVYISLEKLLIGGN